MRFVLVLIALVLTADATFAQDKPWVGKTILTKREAILTDDKGKRVGFTDVLSYEVRSEKAGRLLVSDGRGAEGWLDKSEAVLLEDSVAYFTDRIRQNPKDADAYSHRAAAWNLKGEPDQAIKDYGEALKLKPDRALYNNRGLAWMNKKDYDKAIADFGEAIRIDPKAAMPYNSRGLAWNAKKEHDKAIADHTEAIRLEPNYANAYASRGYAWHDKKEFDKAIADFTEALRLDPKDADAYVNRGLSRRAKKEYDKAVADFTEAIRLEPRNAIAYINRGSARHDQKEYDKAIADYTEALRFDPKDERAFGGRGIVWDRKKDHDKAIVDYTEAIRLSQKKESKAVHHTCRAMAWSDKKDYAKAIADYTEARRLDPKFPMALNGFAWLLATCPNEKMRDGKRAVQLAQEGLKLNKEDAPMMDTLAAAYAEAGNFDEAVRWQERALEDPQLKSDADARRRLELYRKKQPYREN